MDSVKLKDFCAAVQAELQTVFADLCSGISAREDSRAFGAMIERRITDQWADICKSIGAQAMDAPGRRTIYDFACRYEGHFVGFDVKTKDLDSTSYSDGGVCAIGNLMKFIANDASIFAIVEFGHKKSSGDVSLRDLTYIEVAPFHMLPADIYRVENLGTGQVRLNYTIHEISGKIDWSRSTDTFCDIFCELSAQHYERVSRDAQKRGESIRLFKERGFKEFRF